MSKSNKFNIRFSPVKYKDFLPHSTCTCLSYNCQTKRGKSTQRTCGLRICCRRNNWSVSFLSAQSMSIRRAGVQYMKTALLRVITQPVVVIPYRSFGTFHRSHLQGSRMVKKYYSDMWCGVKIEINLFTNCPALQYAPSLTFTNMWVKQHNVGKDSL